MLKDEYVIYDEGFNGCKRLLKNGKAINEFGMLKELNKANQRIQDLENALSELVFDAEQLSSVGYFSKHTGKWTPRESTLDALEVRVKLVKGLLDYE